MGDRLTMQGVFRGLLRSAYFFAVQTVADSFNRSGRSEPLGFNVGVVKWAAISQLRNIESPEMPEANLPGRPTSLVIPLTFMRALATGRHRQSGPNEMLRIVLNYQQ